jgi:hypothetical protein
MDHPHSHGSSDLGRRPPEPPALQSEHAPVAQRQPAAPNLNRLALSATLHCLTGCGIGEVLGLVLGTALGLGTVQTIALAVALAFFFGYLLTMLPLLRSGMTLRAAARLALAADTISIAIMELVDNAVMLLIPGAMTAGLASPLFWGSLTLALAIAAVVAYPVNLYLLRRGRGHAVVHARHEGAGHAH